MKYVTVSEAIRKARQKVVFPALIVMFLTLALAVYFLSTHNGSIILIALAIFLMIFSFVAFGIIMTYFGDKWKIWAYKHVDDVREFRKRAADNNFSVNIFPSRWHLSIKKDRLAALNIVRERIKNNTLWISLNDDYSIPRKLEIKRSFLYYTVPLGICIWICYKTTERLIHGTSTELIIDIIFSTLSFVGIIFFLIKLIKYPTLVSISEEGIWSKKTGHQSWDMVESFGFSAKRVSNTTTGMHITNRLYIKIKPESGIEEKKSLI
ncbi:MAG: hypothetical protein ACOYEG_07295, partial [Petrimonas sp.]